MCLAERSVALQHLKAIDLDEEVQSSLTELNVLGRKASAEIRIRLLPLLDEVKRRYDVGETINKKKGYHEYLRSLGLIPSTVRAWKTRDHQRIVGDILKSAKKSAELDREEKKYERQLKDGIDFAVTDAEQERKEEREEKEFKRRLKEDPDFRRKNEEKEAAWAEQFNRARQAQAREPGNFEREFGFFGQSRLEKNKPPIEHIREFATIGRRAAGVKYHPDKDPTREAELNKRMAEMNRVADWLESAAGVA